ncbi:MAG: phosphatidylglycerophosphatase A [Bdellovibrio bacteriovorus]
MATLPPGFNPRRLHHWIAFGLGSGLVPWAPGTFGTLAAVPLYWLLSPLALVLYLSLVAVLFVLGVWACGRTARDLGGEDPGAIVWDEVVGYLAAMTAAPAGWPWMLAGFLLFRLLDISKPWPIRWLDQHLKGGLGIMLDDLAAGALTAVILWTAVAVLAIP